MLSAKIPVPNPEGLANGTQTAAQKPISAPETAIETPKLYRMGDLLGQWEKDAFESHSAFTENRPRGPVSGLSSLDRDLGGALSPGLHILHGAPGTGKTAFGMQVAASCGVPSLFVTCEMSALELLRRHTARITGTFLGRLKTGELSPEQSLTLARRAVAATPDLVLLDATRAPASFEFLRDCSRIMQENIRQSKAAPSSFLIVVDSLHSWVEGAWPGSQEYEALNFGLAHLRRLAHDINAPLLLLCERNRESMKNGGQSAGAGTRKIEYGAETVIELESDQNIIPNVKGEKVVTVRLSKNRHGTAGGKTELLFNGALQSFTPT